MSHSSLRSVVPESSDHALERVYPRALCAVALAAVPALMVASVVASLLGMA